jgi:hypothetical protein
MILLIIVYRYFYCCHKYTHSKRTFIIIKNMDGITCFRSIIIWVSEIVNLIPLIFASMLRFLISHYYKKFAFFTEFIEISIEICLAANYFYLTISNTDIYEKNFILRAALFVGACVIYPEPGCKSGI